MTDVLVTIPAIPTNPLGEFGEELLLLLSPQLLSMENEINKEDEVRENIFKTTRAIIANNTQLMQNIRLGNFTKCELLEKESAELIDKLLTSINNDPVQREAKLSNLIEKLLIIKIYRQFFVAGRIVSQAELQPANDEEYLGAIFGFAQEVSKYCTGRACLGDLQSILLCRKVIMELNSKMLEFDFRNGPLRRKFDGLKYVLRTIEDIIYEMSLHYDTNNDDVVNPTKKMKLSTETGINDSEAVTSFIDASQFTNTYINAEEIDSIRLRMEKFDKAREEVIKESRDVQKLSKQAIFSVHRGKPEEASSKLVAAAKIANKIMMIVNEYPTLRTNSFSNALEEYGEAILTLEWVTSKTVKLIGNFPLPLSLSEYVGALSDFTGEIGRLAVASASTRDSEQVNDIYQVDLVISLCITKLNFSNKFTKKLDAINTNTKKVQEVMYDLIMLQRSGKNRKRERVDEPEQMKSDTIED